MDSFVLIIFGITGNLAQIKLIPALYDIAEKGLLPENSSIIGTARKPMKRDEFEEYFHSVLHAENKHHKHAIKDEVFYRLCKNMQYLDGNLDDPNFYKKLKKILRHKNKIFYLATYPNLYETIFKNLKKSGLSKQQSGWTRLVIEKPIGFDLKSAKDLNNLLTKYFSEDQIYRLDHYLGKETILNLLTFRFSSGIFEPLINKKYVDHIQITSLEDFGIGARGGYYDSVGALKDVGQNHLLQMIALSTMDAPKSFSNEDITSERIKILKNLAPIPEKVVLGQYKGYTRELNVDPNSIKDTYFAFKTEIKNERFKGVPIFVRGGKNLKTWVTEISVIFKTGNVLIYRIQPNEGIVLKIKTKKPGHEKSLEDQYMQFCYRQDPNGHFLIDPYERLLVDAISGDQTNFNDAKEVEAEWKFIDALEKKLPGILEYKSGTWGPKEADELIEVDGRKWMEPSMEFCRI
ncbi:glucose-6-phosphate dehydrogenase [Candidatus Daviesbacteria bacterium RIFCSPLOWO2_01_FULL_37_10]|nr:MAG: glucose-6-phosphate dehydrogenase [Candidatus Daviesbacteria bacterium RIFCSPLOWO2_01_FULL_37_10]